MSDSDQTVVEQILSTRPLWLILDYDGTLAPFAPNPDILLPDEELRELLNSLAKIQSIRVTILSGRRLAHMIALLPGENMQLAGTYGIELQMPDGTQIQRLPIESVRPELEKIIQPLKELIEPYDGFYLEDKGWSVAIHARYAAAEDAEVIIPAAKNIMATVTHGIPFRIVQGERFLEIAPTEGNKGRTVEWLFAHYPLPHCLSVYIGDDDRDEEAFEVIQSHRGIAIAVQDEYRPTTADIMMKSPEAVREFLWTLVKTSQ